MLIGRAPVRRLNALMSIAGPIDPPGVETSSAETPKRGPMVNRRTVLGAAVAGGAGVAAIRLLGVDGAVERLMGGAGTAVGGRGDWVSPLAAEKARVNQL